MSLEAAMEHHARLRVRFYPHHGEWTCYVQRVDAEGMPLEDVLSSTGTSKDNARENAIRATTDEEIRAALESSRH
jgi:hypothetical protein